MTSSSRIPAAVAAFSLCLVAAPGAQSDRVGRSPWGPHDEIGTLNMMTPASRQAVLSRADATRLFDLSVEYFVGMPSWHLLGDPRYQFWLTHSPRGTAVDDPAGVGAAQNARAQLDTRAHVPARATRDPDHRGRQPRETVTRTRR